MLTVLPTMIHAPTIPIRMATSLSVGWREWKVGADRGSGPVAGYVLYYKTVNSTQWSSIAANLTKPFVLSGLSPNEVYYVTVAAVHQSGAIGLPSPSASEKTCGSRLILSWMSSILLMTSFEKSSNQSLNNFQTGKPTRAINITSTGQLDFSWIYATINPQIIHSITKNSQDI